MIDIDKLQMVADRAIEIGAEKEQLFSAEEVISVFTCLRKAEKDAERYRWLRDLPDGSAHEEIGNYPGDMWDESIDEAMQCSN